MTDITCGNCPNPCGGATPGNGGIFAGTLLAGASMAGAMGAAGATRTAGAAASKTTTVKPCWLMWVILAIVALTFAVVAAKT